MPTAAYLFERELRPAFIGILYRSGCEAGFWRPLFRAYEIASALPSKSYGWQAYVGANEAKSTALDKTRRPAKANNKDNFDEHCHP